MDDIIYAWYSSFCIIASTKEVVCLCFCYQLYVKKSTDQIFMKDLPDTFLWTRKNWLNFGSHLPLDQDLGVLKVFFNIVR